MTKLFTRQQLAIISSCVAITLLAFYFTDDSFAPPSTNPLERTLYVNDSDNSSQIADTDTSITKKPIKAIINTGSNLIPESKTQRVKQNDSLNNKMQEVAQAQPIVQVLRESKATTTSESLDKEKFDRNTYMTEERKALLNGPRNAAKEGRWEDFIAAVESIIQQTNYDIKMSRSLGQAIDNDAPFWVYEKLVEQGQRFDYVHTLHLARSNKLQLIKDLQRLGLDIHAVAPDGENAVYASMFVFRAKDTLDYLILNGVNAQSSVNGVDALEFALEGAIKNARACHFVVELINTANVTVLPKHNALLNQVEQHNDAAYQCITAATGEI